MFDKNIENFIRPITKQPPCGIDLNASGKISWLRDIRLELQKVHGNNTAEWASSQEILPSHQDFAVMCEDLLKSDSKDLTVAIFYIEALFKTDSILGLQHGLYVFNALCENFWKSMYPEYSPDSPELRAVPFKLLQSGLVRMLLSYQIIEGSNDLITLSQVIDETNSIKLNLIKQKIESYLAKTSSQELQQRISFFQDIKESLEKTNDFLTLLEGEEIDLFLAEKYLNQILKLYQNAFDKKENILSNTASEIVSKLEQNTSLSDPLNSLEQENHLQILSLQNSVNIINTQIKNQEEAYILIERANDYLLGQDPQALVPNLLQKNLNYRHLPLTEVLCELMAISKDTNSFLKHFSKTADVSGED